MKSKFHDIEGCDCEECMPELEESRVDIESALVDSLTRERLWEAQERVEFSCISPALQFRFAMDRAEQTGDHALCGADARLEAICVLGHARAYITARGGRV